MAKAKRLIQSHPISEIPAPGYGERLLEIRGNPNETGIELLTNKLLVERGLRPLVRGRDGRYDGTAQ